MADLVPSIKANDINISGPGDANIWHKLSHPWSSKWLVPWDRHLGCLGTYPGEIRISIYDFRCTKCVWNVRSTTPIAPPRAPLCVHWKYPALPIYILCWYCFKLCYVLSQRIYSYSFARSVSHSRAPQPPEYIRSYIRSGIRHYGYGCRVYFSLLRCMTYQSELLGEPNDCKYVSYPVQDISLRNWNIIEIGDLEYTQS